MRLILTVVTLALALPTAADEHEDMAEGEQAQMVRDAISVFGCEADKIEVESENLFEIDDAVCEAGQYDIKVDGEGQVISMTFDGPIDDNSAASSGGSEIEVGQDAIDAIGRMMVQIACQVEPENIEKTSEGYELDDVFCDDGQYDMVLDDNLSVVEKRKE